MLLSIFGPPDNAVCLRGLSPLLDEETDVQRSHQDSHPGPVKPRHPLAASHPSLSFFPHAATTMIVLALFTPVDKTPLSLPSHGGHLRG